MVRGFGSLILIFIFVIVAVAVGIAVIFNFSHQASSFRAAQIQSSSTVSTISVDPSDVRAAANAEIPQLSKYSFLSLTPLERSIGTCHPTSYEKFTYEGITIALPWPGVAAIHSADGLGTQIKFSDGKFVMLVNPYPDQNIRQNFLSSAAKVYNQDTLDELFGQNNLTENSLFFNLVLSSTIQLLSSSTSSPDELLSEAMLVPIKLTLFYDASATAIYKFSTLNYQVFEITDLPTTNQSYIFLYDRQDSGRLITTSANQGEIDCMVSSIHEGDDSQSSKS
jgi:hypothetical protein